MKKMNNLNWPDDFVNKIICGDCLEIMPFVPNESIDLILTDPIYNKLEHYEYLFNIAGKILKKSGQLICYCADIYLPELLRINFYPLQWAKMIVERNVGTKGTLWKLHCKTGCKHALWFYKPPFPKNISWTTDFYYSKPDGKNVRHIWAKNIPTLFELIQRHTNEGDIILDPFLGSGTIIKACKNLKRNFVGIEINPDYCKIAEERLAQGVL